VIPLTALEQMAADSDLSHVVLTGGEPLVVPESVELCRMLRAMGMHVTIETAGTVFQPVECDLMSISPKFASSTPDSADHPRWSVLHEHRRMPIEMIRRLIDLAPAHQLKFVVDSPADYDELLGVVRQLRAEAVNVWVMPQGSTIEEMDAAAQWLEPWTRAQGFQYCDRMQIRWFGNRRGT
jgi:7-carboxy-7-deazaguanine synthase